MFFCCIETVVAMLLKPFDATQKMTSLPLFVTEHHLLMMKHEGLMVCCVGVELEAFFLM